MDLLLKEYKNLIQDVEQIENKPFLKTALKSHLKIITNYPNEIIDKFIELQFLIYEK